MSSRHIINTYGTLVSRNINFYCTLKNDIALGTSASCNIIFPCWQWSPMVSTELPKLPLHFHQVENGLQWSPLSCQLLWQSCQRLPLHCHQVANVKHWQPGGDVLATSFNTVTTVGDSLATHWQLIHNLETMATLGNFFKQFEKVAKRWRPLTIMATYWQRPGDHWRRRAMWWQSPQLSVATTLPAQFRLV